MASPQNMIPTTKMPKEQHLAMSSKGGKRSGEVRREKKKMREQLQMLLNMTMNNGDNYDISNAKSIRDLTGQNLTVQEAILLKQIQKAISGDRKAAEYVRDTAGEKPTEEISVKAESQVHEDLLKKMSKRKVAGIDD